MNTSGKYAVGLSRSDSYFRRCEDWRAGRRTLRVISNFRRLDGISTERFSVAHRFADYGATLGGAIRLFWLGCKHDLIVLNNDTRRLFMLCFLRWLVPFYRCKLVSVDIVLSRPVGWKGWLVTRVKALLLRKVDRFILYFTDLDGYNRFYGISSARATYVPFKVNSWGDIPPVRELSADGEYVFTGGRSFRDLRTFIAAMRQVGYPGVLLYHAPGLMRRHGTQLDVSSLPSNLVGEEDNGSGMSWLRYIRGAKVVVVPTLPSSISATGISMYLSAMALRKCVIISEGPATRGLLKNEAIIIPPADPQALAGAIRRAWEDDELRERTANAGRRYAERLGGESRLLSDILDVCGDMVTQDSKVW